MDEKTMVWTKLHNEPFYMYNDCGNGCNWKKNIITQKNISSLGPFMVLVNPKGLRWSYLSLDLNFLWGKHTTNQNRPYILKHSQTSWNLSLETVPVPHCAATIVPHADLLHASCENSLHRRMALELSGDHRLNYLKVSTGTRSFRCHVGKEALEVLMLHRNAWLTV